MDQLRRETQPPAGMLPSPVPQYWNPDTEQYERVLGANGAPRAILYGPNGQPISSSNPLETRVQGTVTAAIRDSNGNPITAQNRLPVDVGGQIHADVDLGDVTVQIGEVQQGKRGTNAEPWEVSLSGSSVPYTAPLYVNRPVRSQMQTLLNAVSVPAGGDTGWVNVSPGGERYTILVFNCDQPWRAWTNAPWALVPYSFLYPRRNDADQNPAPLLNYPSRSIVVAPLIETGVASMAEAFAAALPWNGLQVRISNNGAATATITLRVLRLFV